MRHCVGKVNVGDITEVVFQLGATKPPGLDDFSGVFFRHIRRPYDQY